MTLCLLRERRSDYLLVVFNSYADLALADPTKPFSTHLQGYRFFCSLDTSVMWVAEQEATWYTENDADILNKIIAVVRRKEIKTVAFFGMSSGGFAAIRFACLLDDLALSSVTSITSVTINPVTGFRKELLDAMVASVDEFGWDQEARRTMLESDQFRSALGTRHELELRQQLRAAQAATERASHHVLYNATNPFDSTFADDLSDDSVHKWPCQIESNHHDGCYMIFDWLTQQERFAALFPAPFSVLEDISVVVI